MPTDPRNCIALPVITSGPDGIVQFANAAALQMFGRQLVGEHVRTLYHPTKDFPRNSPSRIKEELVARGGTLQDILVQVLARDAAIITVHASFILDDKSGSTTAVLVGTTSALQNAFAKITDSLFRTFDQEHTLEVITAEARRLTRAHRAYLKLIDFDHSRLAFHGLSSVDADECISERDAPVERGMTGFAFHIQRQVRSADVRTDSRFDYHPLFANTVSKVVTPLSHPRAELCGLPIVFGVLVVDGTVLDQFGPDDEDLLELLARCASIAIVQGRYFAEREKIYSEIFPALGKITINKLAKDIVHRAKNIVRLSSDSLGRAKDTMAVRNFAGTLVAELDLEIVKMRAAFDTLGELGRALELEESVAYAPVPIDVKRAAMKIAMLLQTPQIGIEVLCSVTIPLAFVPKYGLNALLYNVLDNAVHAIQRSGKGKSITVTVSDFSEDSRLLRIVVEDDGPGISKEKLRSIRDALAQEFQPGSTGGTGLGLLQTRQLLKEMSGTFQIDSVFGRGTTVTLTLPRA
jgi:hypothetical protein